MPQTDFSAWNDFLNQVKSAEEQMGAPPLVWYRGVNDERHELRPSLLRRANGVQKERDLFTKYRLLSAAVHPDRASDWQLLCDMQHYRIPTRLLDWTEVLGIAVFFALLGNSGKDAAVYVLDPLTLNKVSSRQGIPSVDEETDFNYRTLYWDHKPMPPVAPIAVHTQALNRRVLAQRGTFTVHGTDLRPVEAQCPQAIRKIRLTHRVKDGAKEYLKIAGINEFSVFPDVAGLAPFLEAIVGLL